MREEGREREMGRESNRRTGGEGEIGRVRDRERESRVMDREGWK